MKRTTILISIMLAGVFAPTWARADTNLVPPQIQNLVAGQRPGTMVVDISYDLVDPDSSNLYMLVECSADNGTTYGVPIYALSGDVMKVTPGAGKKIVWNAWSDWPLNFTTNAKIRLTADDIQSALPAPPTNAPALNLVWIPAGAFEMGSPDSYYYVCISRSFWMGKYEVTQAEFLEITGSNPSYYQGNTNLPVESVTWDAATNYCALLTAREQAAGRIGTDQVYRLPTEAEWEYACRAGTTNEFYYGDDPSRSRLHAYAWYSANSGGHTQLGGARIPNRWGLYDMEGNVSEWCTDWFSWLFHNVLYTGLPTGTVTDPQGPQEPDERGHVIRGANCTSSASECASKLRARGLGSPPWYAPISGATGLRVVLAPTQ